MNIVFKNLTHKEFSILCKSIILRGFHQVLENHNKLELLCKLKYYCQFIIYYITSKNIERMDDFVESIYNDNYIQSEDAKIIIDLFESIKVVLMDTYTYIDIKDIKNFCIKVESDIRL